MEFMISPKKNKYIFTCEYIAYMVGFKKNFTRSYWRHYGLNWN